MATKNLMTSSQAAAQVGVTTTGLQRAIDRGALLPVAYTLRGARLFDPADVERVAEAREVLRLADRRRRPPPT
jgi:DNA-binding transcriptional MerR regulator